MTERAERMTLRELADLRSKGEDPLAAIRRAIANGWQGVAFRDRGPPRPGVGPQAADDRPELKPL